jgi:flagellar hook assembly protein FlgD
VFCSPTVGINPPLASGNVFIASSSPNPFRNSVTLNFTLPQSGPVMVEIYAADGRRVQTLAKGEMGAGPHSLQWDIDRSTPSGVYFYRVVAGTEHATGKLMRID